MKKLKKSLVFVVHLISMGMVWALDAQQVFERVSPSIVIIKTNNSMGSGVIYGVDNSGLVASSLVLTNCHVVNGSSQVTVERLGKQSMGNVKSCDSERDIAIVVLGGVLPTVSSRSTPVKVGEPVFAVGAPLGLELSISQGIVSQLRSTKLGKDPMIQTTASISKGSSGGGLFDGEGRLLGLTTSYLNDSQNLNFAIPFNFILEIGGANTFSKGVVKSASSSDPIKNKCGWKKMTMDADHGYQIYIDYCLIKNLGKFREIWTLTNYSNLQASPDRINYFQSRVDKFVHDCDRSRMMLPSFYIYKKQMAQGEIIFYHTYSDKELDFKDYPPGSNAELISKIVCN